MCGRFVSKADDLTWEEYCRILSILSNVTFLEETQCFPGSLVHVAKVDPDGKSRRHTTMPWGIPPTPRQREKGARLLFNLRSDRITHTFPKELSAKRCLLPASSFFEWKQNPSGHKKTAFQISLRERKLFSFAGIWAVSPKADGTLVEHASMLTTTPNEQIAALHHRMPVILTSEGASHWLDPALTAKEALALLVPCSEPMLIEPLPPSPPRKGAQAELW